MRKPIRTLSGVTPIAIMLPPRACPHGACIYCPTLDAPQSYTPKSPVVLRAAAVKYDASIQVKQRMSVLEKMGHPTDKVELIIMGGTFLSYPVEFQYKFVKECFDSLNEKNSKNLEEAKKMNENAPHRCVALCIETRPDFCGEEEIKRMIEFGATRVELGVQVIDDKIYELVNRGHKVNDVIEATKRLKEAGFKIGYHLMPGLPGSSPKKDLEMYKKIFSSDLFKPDQVKIYPCQVLKGSALEHWYSKGEFKPYSKIEVRNIIIKMLKATPRYCRVMRIMREIPREFLVAGQDMMSIRNDIEEELRKNKIKLNEIRYREIGFEYSRNKKVDTNVKIKLNEYNASGGKEYFIEAVNKQGTLFGLLRLRFEKDKKIGSMVRELHVYGKAVVLGDKKERAAQHQGLGKELMKKAEKLSKKKGMKKIRVISGVGVREYYKKMGYELDEKGYMRKELS